MIVEIIDRANLPASNRPKKPAKDEPKMSLNYSVRNNQNEQPLQAKTEVPASFKLKQLKKSIQDELGITGKPNIKLYHNGTELSDEKISLKDSGIFGSHVEVEIFIKVLLEV